jgi:hypothetical protein
MLFGTTEDLPQRAAVAQGITPAEFWATMVAALYLFAPSARDSDTQRHPFRRREVETNSQQNEIGSMTTMIANRLTSPPRPADVSSPVS